MPAVTSFHERFKLEDLIGKGSIFNSKSLENGFDIAVKVVCKQDITHWGMDKNEKVPLEIRTLQK